MRTVGRSVSLLPFVAEIVLVLRDPVETDFQGAL